VTSSTDQRRLELEQWVSEHCGAALQGEPASSDASFRRYFRFHHQGRSLVAMDAPPQTEDCRPFVQIAGLLAGADVHCPAILAQDLERGFLLLSDLGTQTYLDVINNSNAEALFADAIEALLAMQQIGAEDCLPPYDEALLRRELELFPDWYLDKHLGVELDQSWRQLLDQLFDEIIGQVLGQSRCFVHRDFMPRNLMVSEPNPGVIDFQDAVFGPISYDPICLFKDAFLSWPQSQVEQGLQLYWSSARQLGLPVPGQFQDFLYDCDVMGLQRHLKVIGIFARICHRDGKPHYLADVPRFFGYLREVSQRRPDWQNLEKLLDKLAPLSQGLTL
jgi:aminoglycoside/choline kinase family phosphotransferase